MKQRGTLLRRKFVIISITLWIGFLVFTTDVMSMSTQTYQITGDATGTFTLDHAFGATPGPTMFLSWDIVFDFMMSGITDPLLGNQLNSCMFRGTACFLDDFIIGRRFEDIEFVAYPGGTWFAEINVNNAPGLVSGRFTAAPAAVPEPTTMLLFGSGLVGLIGYRWQQRRREGTQVG